MQLSAEMAARTRNQRGDMRTNLIIGGLVVFALIVLIFGLILQLSKVDPNSLRGVADRYVTALFKADTTTTYALHSSAFKQRVAAADWNHFVTLSYKDYSGTAPKYIKTESVSDPYQAYASGANPQRVTYQTTLNKVTYNISIVLVVNGSSWLIDEVEVDKV